MTKEIVLNEIQEVGVLAVLRGPSPDLTLKMVDALIKGGVTGIEITYTTPNAAEVVKSLDQQFGSEIVLGMGTLTKPEQVEEAVSAGATFLVSPHTDTTLGTEMASSGLPVMMGALTPSEVMKAVSLGSDVVKVFPGSLGGPAYMKALKGPFPDIPMMPTGGVSESNLVDWFKAGAFAVGAGSKLCPKEFALTGEFEKITQVAAKFMAAVKAARN
jgi:2-dehydro-3-deoxyphosphogluconate aldolase/(4S)-4-hydroxy-2-oxoglutarate aldolase